MIEIDFSTFRGAFTPLAPLFFFLRRAILKTGDFQISHLGGGRGCFQPLLYNVQHCAIVDFESQDDLFKND